MRLAALIFGILGALAHLVGAIIAILIGLLNENSSFDYAEMVEGLINNMGGNPQTFSFFGDFERLLIMGIISLAAFVVGCVGLGFAMFMPRVAMWLLAPPAVIGLLAIIVAYHSAPGLIILGTFAMVLFLWAAALEYLDNRRQRTGSETASTTTEADAGEDEAEGEAAPA